MKSANIAFEIERLATPQTLVSAPFTPSAPESRAQYKEPASLLAINK